MVAAKVLMLINFKKLLFKKNNFIFFKIVSFNVVLGKVKIR
ncbi:hypothetical protein FDUTEX481_03345 [Tolypothrix sp. PCC 7601]|nr:hypothetical protein FDUTEX481_03345 [Tolypothrix sp. PCC 7601]